MANKSIESRSEVPHEVEPDPPGNMLMVDIDDISISSSDFFDEPRLYILMRTDLASMNPGKAVAQGAHAANMFNEMMVQVFTYSEHDESPHRRYEAALHPFREWAESAGIRKDLTDISQGFGTTICLGVNERQLKSVTDMARMLALPSGVVHDPSYPLRDGDFVHLLPMDTCGFVFVGANLAKTLLAQFELMP